MSTKWSTEIVGQSNTGTNFGELFKDDYGIIYMRGKNGFGDIVYCYVKVMMADLDKMKSTLDSGRSFHPSDFGTVIAAGRNEPTLEVKAELALAYPMLSQPKHLNMQIPLPPQTIEKKAWDEY